MSKADAVLSSLQAKVIAAAEARHPLRIRGGGTKDFLGASLTGELLDVTAYAGIVDYEPRELVLTVRAGTRLSAVEQALEEQGQMLAFEPPHFGPNATIGGMVAAGLSGPRRAHAGAVRDFMLGARILDGKGQDMTFGGRVIKNVAGYDVTRLMAGAMGTLGVLLECSFKVLPKPVRETTLRFETSQAEAIERMNLWAASPLPLSATSWHGGVLHVRLSGTDAGVAAAVKKLGGEVFDDAASWWRALREQQHSFFSGAMRLARIALPPTTANIRESSWVEWGGAQRWLSDVDDLAGLRAEVVTLGGHVTLHRGAQPGESVFHPLASALLPVHRRLKATFDPAGILNPGRLDSF